MRDLVDAERIAVFMRELGAAARGPGRVYLVGGATAVLLGWRRSTIDIDLKLDPEPPGAFGAIARLKDSLGINVELAAPDDFIPPLPGWPERSVFIVRQGEVEFLHYDFYAQALAKIERGHAQDLEDVAQMRRTGRVDAQGLRAHFDRIRPALIRYPAIDPTAFAAQLDAALRDV